MEARNCELIQFRANVPYKVQQVWQGNIGDVMTKPYNENKHITSNDAK